LTYASEIIQDAAALILVAQDDIGLEANEFSQGARLLNDWCAMLFDLGIDFGYRPVASSGDPVTSPNSTNLALKQNLGILMAPMFGVAVSADLRADAKSSLNSLRNRFMARPKASVPVNLPRGSGGAYQSESYYPFALPQSILRLNSSSTVTIATINVAVILAGWTVDRSTNVTALAAGTVEYLSDSPYLASFDASLTINAASSDQFTFYFAKNGAILEQSAVVFDADAAQNVLLHWNETLRRGDKISIVVANNSSTTDLVVTNGHFMVN
jgi:hypothetical protein